jgi:hypothetical protein
MRLRRYDLTYLVAIATVAIGLIITQPATANGFSNPLHATLKVVAKTTTTTVKVVPKTTTTTLRKPAPVYLYGVTPADVAAWTKVAICEEGGNWHVRGSKYSGGLGILNSNWTYYSRGMGFPASAADATPIQQIAVAKKINAGYAVPDQYGCAAW